MRTISTRLTPRLEPELVLALAALVAVAIADSRRTAVLAALAAAGVLATRIRYGARVALGLTVLVALLAVTGHGLSA